MHKSSQNSNESKENQVFQFEMTCTKKDFQLDNGKSFKIKNTWVENDWSYDCIDNKPVLKKDASLQFVIDGEYIAAKDSLNYVLMVSNNSYGNFLGGQLYFRYSKQDTFQLILQNAKSKIVVNTLKFYKTKDR